jgi:hypothetical protein
LFDTNAHAGIARVGSGELSLKFAPGLFENLSIILIESILQPDCDFEIRQVRRCRFVIFHSEKNEQVLRLSAENAPSANTTAFGIRSRLLAIGKKLLLAQNLPSESARPVSVVKFVNNEKT